MTAVDCSDVDDRREAGIDHALAVERHVRRDCRACGDAAASAGDIPLAMWSSHASSGHRPSNSFVTSSMNVHNAASLPTRLVFALPVFALPGRGGIPPCPTIRLP